MGYGSEMKCPKCGFEFFSRTGVGFSFPTVYEETVQKAKSGKLGEEAQAFFKEHSDGSINAEYVTLCCDECGELFTGQDLTMYAPKYGYIMRNSYVFEDDLERYYSEELKYPHKCEKCGGSAHVVDSEETLLCPRCKVPMEAFGSICWD